MYVELLPHLDTCNWIVITSMYFTACTSTSGGSNLVVSIDEATAQGLLSTLYSS